MPAPYVISHLQVGIALQHIGAPLSEDANERAAVYLQILLLAGSLRLARSSI